MPHSKAGSGSPHPESYSFQRCWAEIDFSALRHNVAVVRDLIGPEAGIMAVVKTNAYGHGVEDLARELRYLVEMFGVANATEALQLRRIAPEAPILILGPALAEEREAIIRHEFIPVISSVEEARAYAALLDKREDGSPAGLFNVHLKVDTGMGRIGVWWENAVDEACAIQEIPGLRLAGVATHLPSADEDFEFTTAQLARWEALLRDLRAAGIDPPAVHALNSAGAIRFAESLSRQAEWEPRNGGLIVRAGLALYGSSPLPEFQAKLRPILAWKSRIILVRDVPAGRGVSYGRTFVTPEPMRIATVAVGYGDGYHRSLSNRGTEVLIGGRRCALLGRVTMDQILVDVTSVPGAASGDEAVIMGRQGSEEILAAELAEKAGTIPWEIFTSIGGRVTRRYIAD